MKHAMLTSAEPQLGTQYHDTSWFQSSHPIRTYSQAYELVHQHADLHFTRF
jgi:hypothetical protein